MIKVGTRVRRKNPFFGKTSDIGEVFEVVYVSDKRIEAAKKTKDRSSVYSFSPDEFSEYFDIVGMETTKKNPDNKMIIGTLTEGELDYLWYESDSYETFKEMLKIAVKKKDKPQKKREWTPWAEDPETGYLYSVSHPVGQSAKLKVNVDGFIGTASCSPDDVWDRDLGIELAAARAEMKQAKAWLAEAEEKLEESQVIYDCCKDSLGSILRRIYRKEAK